MSVRDWEDRIRRQEFETVVAFDSSGSVILRKNGQKFKVEFTDNELAILAGSTLTHNHPNGLQFADDDPRSYGNSFSRADLHLACLAELTELRVVTPRLRFSLKPPVGGWNENYWLTVLMPVYDRHKAVVSTEFPRGSCGKTVAGRSRSAAFP